MSKVMTDLTGRKFGRLIVQRPTERRLRGRVVWECLCDCGNTFYADAGALTSGDTRSCGCLRKEHGLLLGANNRIDVQGQRFGKLVAIRALDERKNGQTVWECKCDCGKLTLVLGNNLRDGKTRSCGCLFRAPTNNLTGMRFGKLVALKASDERKHGYVIWECKCDCGKTVFVSSSELRRGKVVSCGCDKSRNL